MASATITTSEVADLLGVHPATVRRLANQGVLPAVRTTPTRRSPRRFRVEDVVGVLRRTQEGATR